MRARGSNHPADGKDLERGAARRWPVKRLTLLALMLIVRPLNIAASTASESAMRGRQIVEERGLKLLEEAKSENPRNVP